MKGESFGLLPANEAQLPGDTAHIATRLSGPEIPPPEVHHLGEKRQSGQPPGRPHDALDPVDPYRGNHGIAGERFVPARHGDDASRVWANLDIAHTPTTVMNYWRQFA